MAISGNHSANSTGITRRGLLRAGVRSGLALAVGTGGSLAWGRFGEPDWLEVVELDLPLPRLSPVFDGLRLAQISDIHIESGSMAENLPALCEMVNRQKADVICLTGDYISYTYGRQEEPLYQGLKALRAPLGVFAVMGNHDQWAGIDQPRRALRRAGIRELRNEVVTLRRGGDQLHICGVDDLLEGPGDLEPVRAALPADGCALVLVHEPDYADAVSSCKRFDLMLSGHSHGGQICLPFGRVVHVPSMANKYPAGLYRVNQMQLYTNRGLGTVGLPIRLFCRPEITVFTLRSGHSV